MVVLVGVSFVCLCVGFLLIGIASIKEAFWPIDRGDNDPLWRR